MDRRTGRGKLRLTDLGKEKLRTSFWRRRAEVETWSKDKQSSPNFWDWMRNIPAHYKELKKQVTSNRNGLRRAGDPWSDPVRFRHAFGNDRLRVAHLEGDRLHRGQHRGCPDHLGRPVDVVRRAEHRPDAVQDARLDARSQPRPPGGPRAHGHLVRHVRNRADGGDRRRAVHQLHQDG